MSTLRRGLPAALALLACLGTLVAAPVARAAFDNSTPRGTFAGTHNYTVIGNTLRTQPNTGNACALGASSSATLSALPVGSTVVAAYLYWGGSGPTPDTQVTFAGNAVTADEVFTDNFTITGTYDLDYFGGFEDVTSLVTGNGSYTFGGLTVAATDDFGGNAQADYCGVQAVVAAWSLIVVYTNPAENYRFTRVYDGLQYFRGSSVTTTQSGFRVPDLVDGKVTTVTWEGDPDVATSFALDGYDEALSFDGFPLLNSGCDIANNLYNSTIGFPSGSCTTTSYGADIDTYDVTPFLYEGQTGATLQYSSGNDLVLLTAQVISTTNTPVADLGITKSHVGNFTAGQNGSFSVVVHNFGPEIATGTTTVTDTLPAGLSYVSGTGTGWSCAAAGQVVTCNHSSTSIAVGADLPTLTITAAVGASAAASVDNVATVSHPMFDGTGGNQSDTDTVTILKSNLSTSTKSVVDLNGGDANPGDVLRYTITLNETGGQGVAATGVQVVDDLPAKVGSLSVVSTPAGSTNQSVGTGGANGTGQVKVIGITVPAGGSATIVFDVTISGTALPGDTITNTATITNASGTGATPSVGTTVAASQGPASGNKVLYLYDNLQLTRTPQVANTTGISIGGGSTQTWTLTAPVPATKSLQLPAQTVAVRFIATQGSGGGPARNVAATLLNGASVIGTSAGSCSVGGTNVVCNLSVTIPATTIAAGGTLGLRLSNDASKADRLVLVAQKTAGQGASTITFSSSTVVNVDTVAFYSAAYPATTQKTTWAAGETVYVRASISDPFGGYDVSAARLTFTDPNGVVRVNDLAMGAVTSPTNATGQSASRIFEYAYVLPASPPYGNWIAAVTGVEGTEAPSVTHVRNGIFTLQPNALTITKSHAGNFIAGTNGVYTLTVNNTGGGVVSGTTTVTDTLATGLTFVSGTGTGWTCGAAGQVVTCTSTTAIPAASSMAPITLTVAVAGNMGNSVDNKAAVGNSTIGGGFMTDGNTDTATILHPDLSTSTKTVQDLDGGDADPGDALRYTITLKESAGVAASNLSVSDTITGNLENFAVNAGLTTCNGADASTSSQLSRTGISLAASAQCVIVFDATVSQFAGAGLEINNTATITNPAGPGASPAAPTVTVSASQQAASGNKYLYVYSNQTMSRVPHAATGTLNIAAAGSQSFTLGAVSKPLVLTPGSQVQVFLWLQRTGDATNTQRTVYVQLFKNGVQQIGGNSAQISFNTATLTRQQFTITVPSLGGAGSLAAGDTLVLRVQNITAGANQTVGFGQWVDTGTVVPDKSSLVSLTTATVINVDSIDDFAAAYPATTTRAVHAGNDVVYIRSVISDPFGGGDVSAANLTITDSDGVVRLTGAAMTPVALSGATRTFEYAYTLPAGAVTGVWNVSVTGLEGTEGMVTHTANAPLGVGVADLVLAKSHVGDFTAGQNASYSLVVHNNGVALSGPTTVTDTLPAGLTYVSGTGTGWSCGAVGQDVTCTSNDAIAQDADLPTLTLTVAVSTTAPASIDNVAAVANAAVNSGTPLPSNTDTANVLQPDLSTSTKTVVDINGGDADPGDTLRYTVTLVETGGAAAVDASVTDDIPAGVTGFGVVSVPPGATDASTGGGGANGTGYLDVTGIDIAANGSATVVFDVVVGAGASPGDTIDNTATVLAPDGTPTPVVAPTVVVSPSQLAGSGNKLLYLYDTLALTRTPQPAATTAGVQVAAGTNRSWVLSPTIPAGETLVLSAGTIAVSLAVTTGGTTVDIQAQLFDGATLVGQSTVQTFSAGAATTRLFTVNLAADYTLVAGDALTLRLVNTANGNKHLQVYQYNGGASTISFPTSTVVNVDSVNTYADAWPGTTTQAYYVHGDTVRVRAVASDPFGSADVSAAEVTITDPDGTVIVNAQPMAVVDSNAASKTFEYAFVIPAQADIGAWTTTVTAHEGTEGTISDDGAGGFALRGEVVLGATWGAANAGDAVSLAIAGGLDAVAGSSTAPATTTNATAASLASATLTLSEAFTTGSANTYTVVLACTRNRDGAAITVTGSALARTITMPTDSSVACSWTNTLTTPVSLVKLSTVQSDPVNGTANPKAIPGAVVEYQLIFSNPAATPVDSGTLVVTDPVPDNVVLRVADLGGAGSGPVSFTNGSPASGLTFTFTSLSSTTDDVDFSSNDGATWTYVPAPDGNGFDAAVTDIRVNPKGAFAGNNAQFTLRYRVRVE